MVTARAASRPALSTTQTHGPRPWLNTAVRGSRTARALSPSLKVKVALMPSRTAPSGFRIEYRAA